MFRRKKKDPQAIIVPNDPNSPLKKKIRRRSKNPAHKLYFHSGTQVAIILYQKSLESKDREKIYTKDILPAFEKLVENLINIHKFSALHDSYDDLKNDCVNFLFESLGKFDDTRGTNAFSYFNVVAKNWLIIKTKQKSQKLKRNISLDDQEALTPEDQQSIEDQNIVLSQEETMEHKVGSDEIVNILFEMRNKAKKENELILINAIITIFQNVNEIDILNKTGIFIYLRELTGFSSKQLSTSLNQIRKYFKRLKLDFLNTSLLQHNFKEENINE